MEKLKTPSIQYATSFQRTKLSFTHTQYHQLNHITILLPYAIDTIPYYITNINTIFTVISTETTYTSSSEKKIKMNHN